MPQIIPIKELKNTAEISELVHAAEEPVYITKNGYGDMVIMSVEMYENILKRLNMYHELELSERQNEPVRTEDARQSLGKLREKYEL
jgi:prevent-host-death family protein